MQKNLNNLEDVEGLLTVNVHEAIGKDIKGQYVWDGKLEEAFLRVEVRGGLKNVKVNTSKVKVLGMTLLFEQPFKIAIPKKSSEMRILILKDKAERRGVIVFAACGIVVNDIYKACPIEKYFDVYNPKTGKEAGRVKMRLEYQSLKSMQQNSKSLEEQFKYAQGVRLKRRPSQIPPTINTQNIAISRDHEIFDENEEIRQLQQMTPSPTRSSATGNATIDSLLEDQQLNYQQEDTPQFQSQKINSNKSRKRNKLLIIATGIISASLVGFIGIKKLTIKK